LPSLKDANHLLKRSLPLGVASLAIISYSSMDHVLISKILNVEMAGFYRAGSQIAGILAIIGISFVSSVFPFLSKLPTENNNDRTNYLFYISSRYLLMIGIGIGFLSSKIINLMYGPNYFETGPVLTILVWAQVVIYMSIIAADNLLAKDLRKKVMNQTIISLIVSLALYPPLIYFFGIIGAAISQFTLQLVGLIYLNMCIIKIGISVKKLWTEDLIKLVISGISMSFVLFLTNEMNIFIQIAMGLVTYILFLFIIKFLSSYDVKLVRQIIKINR
jgi:O-antigen/teichoic acid export membrane protein